MPSFRPQPVYARNLPLGTLHTAELFVVTALRQWVLAQRDIAGPLPDWRQGFAHARIPEGGADGFDGLLRIVAMTAIRSLDVRCTCAARLGGDEAWLLQIVGLLQRDRLADAAAALADWLPPSAVRLALGPVETFAAALAARNLWIPFRHAAATRHADLLPAMASASSDAALLH